MAELTEAQRAKRRQNARDLIELRLRETRSAWARPMRQPNYPLAADIALDSLGELATEILTDGTMLRGLDIVDGDATLDLEPATEILKIFVACMRGMLDGYGAENYLETEMSAPSISMDLRHGDNPMDSYTVTIQRRTRPTPHEFRQKAEQERDSILQIVATWNRDAALGQAVRKDLIGDLEVDGHTLPQPAED